MKALATALMVTATLAGMSAAHADGKTREQVQQELQAAKAAGQVTFGELDYPPATAAGTGMSREQVGAELQSAKIAGQVTSAELDYPPRSAAPETAGKTREQVRAELAQAKARGEYTFGELDYPPGSLSISRRPMALARCGFAAALSARRDRI